MDTRALGLTVFLVLGTAPALAVEPLYKEVASYVGVPADLMYAMSKAESGLLRDNRFQPWPWTLNVAGRPQRFDNRDAMFEGLMRALGTGEQSIDVGPMQINWFWQFERMGSPWRMTDPAVTIKIAAQIFRSQYERSGDWWDAVGRYHRPANSPKDQLIADQYRKRVRYFYNKTSDSRGETNAT